jgi:5-methylcytosine-specific restriction protein B
VDWRMKGSWSPGRNLVIKTITNIGKHPALVADIRAALGITPGETSIKTEAPVGDYGLEDAVRELFLDETKIKEALNLLRYKKNVVLQGPPGVGKTFFAKRLAYLLLGAKDKARFRQVQFHQSYAYEDFVQGYRPGESGNFERVDGPFLRFCEDALQDQESPYILMIDEINRGNLSKIFGELLLLIEADKRSPDWATWLAYSTKDDQPFHVPPNLYVIGTMNTADRSLAMIDYALRRRFAFVPIEPAFASKQFAAALAALDVDRELATQLEERLVALNKQIRDDPHLGDGFCIGHSYFCQVGSGQEADESWYEQIVRTEIEPLLREYWFDSKDTADEAVASLRGD